MLTPEPTHQVLVTKVPWSPDKDAHLPVYVCETCGEGFPVTVGLVAHLMASGHDGAKPYWVAEVYLGTVLRWRPDTTEGFWCIVKAFGHDGVTPHVGLTAYDPSPGTAGHLWWVPFATFVEACFPGEGADDTSTPEGL